MTNDEFRISNVEWGGHGVGGVESGYGQGKRLLVKWIMESGSPAIQASVSHGMSADRGARASCPHWPFEDAGETPALPSPRDGE